MEVNGVLISWDTLVISSVLKCSLFMRSCTALFTPSEIWFRFSPCSFKSQKSSLNIFAHFLFENEYHAGAKCRHKKCKAGTACRPNNRLIHIYLFPHPVGWMLPSMLLYPDFAYFVLLIVTKKKTARQRTALLIKKFIN